MQDFIFNSLFTQEARNNRPHVQQPEPLPMTMEEVTARGWDQVDIVFVTGDAYVDHPSFAAALLARVLEADGFRVAILSQPDWQTAEPWKTFGKPRLGFCVSAGNMDSMINHYTANRKVRNDDAYTPGGVIGKRPDRATLSYCQRAREAWPGVTIVTGGVEASLRRLAHYDYWSDRVRRSILLDSKATFLSYGMGETSLLEIFRRLDLGTAPEGMHDIRGTAWRLGKTQDLPEESATVLHLPSFEEVGESPEAFAEMTRLIYLNLNPYCAKTLVQEHGEEAVVVNPPSLPLTTEQMDAVYDLPFTRRPHPSYAGQNIPALEVVQNSVPILRGCFGGCAFCSLTAHQGKFVQCRSENSIISEIKNLAAEPDFSGTISDLSGPTANMYGLDCSRPEQKEICKRPSCLHPVICPNLKTSHEAMIHLMQKARQCQNVKNVFIASGIRTDLALESPEFLEQLVCHHIGGHLKTAPEHVDPVVLDLMQKPPIEKYEEFCDQFAALNQRHGKEQYLVPYLIAGLPGSSYRSMAAVAEYLKVNDIRPEQVQDFIPAPFELATCMYYTGLNPFTGEKVYVPRGLRERRLQRALLFYYRPENYHDVKSALKEANREDLIGNGPNCLIPAWPPKGSALQQSSRVKRLKRKTDKEKLAKDTARQEIIAKAARERREQEAARRGYRPHRSSSDRFRRPDRSEAPLRERHETSSDESRPPREDRDRRDDRRGGFGGERRDDRRGGF
ncbi:MAG: YgiQ family radical SAM protein, partial [Planctomycetia bacterium]|nr:YgiQ family radical SAM protein [Planctomycetia bacterium]